jgi:hypothetical protein
MSQYHDRTLKLLGSEGALDERSVAELIEWARTNDVILPAAYLEWARLDGNNLLRKYSNDDWFFFEDPEIVVTPEGVREFKDRHGDFGTGREARTACMLALRRVYGIHLIR